MPEVAADLVGMRATYDVLIRFGRLGLTSFGGPVAHLGYFRREFVERARWLDDAAFTEIVALCSVLPGPTSSQVGIVLGLRRAGWPGALAAWFAFSLPSALALGAFGIALGSAGSGGTAHAPALAAVTRGLLAAAAAVVLLAVVGLTRTLVTTRFALALAGFALVAGLVLDRYAADDGWLVLVVGGVLGAAFGRTRAMPRDVAIAHVTRRTGLIAGGIFAVLLVTLPLVSEPGSALGLFALFFRAGSLVFGGGHVVLAFLQHAIGTIVDRNDFFAGYGAAQAVPGPLFTFAAFLGADNTSSATGIAGAAIALAGIFAPSFLLVAAAVPLWRVLRALPRAGAALEGINATVVGLLAAVFVDPIATSLARTPFAALLALVAFAVLARTQVPTWAVVLGATLLSVGGELSGARFPAGSAGIAP
ncbi:MAG: chromate efflux transporter [Vulcanimicrobiaceae bacterium]